MLQERDSWENIIKKGANESCLKEWIAAATMAELLHVLTVVAPHLPLHELASRTLDIRIAQINKAKTNLALIFSGIAVLVSLYSALNPTRPAVIVQMPAQQTTSTNTTALKVPSANP